MPSPARFAYEHDRSGRVTVTPVEPLKPKEAKPARAIRRGWRTYLVNDQPITDEDVRKAMADVRKAMADFA